MSQVPYVCYLCSYIIDLGVVNGPNCNLGCENCSFTIRLECEGVPCIQWREK